MWDRVYVTVWYGLIAMAGLYELYSMLDRRDTTPMLTNVLVAETHWWVTMSFLVWLVVHFGSRFLEKHGLWRAIL